MSDIGPGDWVECVGGNGSPHAWEVAKGQKPDRGRIYQVDRVGRAVDRLGQTKPTITLVSPKAWSERGREIGWRVEYFRPIYRPKQSIIEKLKQPAKVSEPEAA